MQNNEHTHASIDNNGKTFKNKTFRSKDHVFVRSDEAMYCKNGETYKMKWKIEELEKQWMNGFGICTKDQSNDNDNFIRNKKGQQYSYWCDKKYYIAWHCLSIDSIYSWWRSRGISQGLLRGWQNEDENIFYQN